MSLVLGLLALIAIVVSVCLLAWAEKGAWL